MSSFPHDRGFDSSLEFLSQGYDFISQRCARYQSDVFQTRLALQPVICTLGEEAAAMFYHRDRFTRRGAVPPTVVRLLQDLGSVQTLDGRVHRHRKQMFMSLMESESIQNLADLMAHYWRDRLPKWQQKNEITLHLEAREILCQAGCHWAGIPLTEQETQQRTREFAAMIHGSGSFGLGSLQGLLLRQRTERWARQIITAVRDDNVTVPEGSAVQIIANHRDLNGKLLDTKVAAVELINLLRPMVAIARWITFAALALHNYPQWQSKLPANEGNDLEYFVHEVRRYYPFFPAVAGRVCQEFDWRGEHFREGTIVLLDLYGTNRDARIWGQPDTFQPERFQNWNGSAFNFIPQGGGDYLQGHRCPGEWISIELTKVAVNLLVSAIQYEVPEQNLTIDRTKLPAIPQSRMVLSKLKALN